MSKVAIVFWSQTGNTETMANCIAEGAGANATIIPCSEMNAAKLGEYDVVAFGCPAMGAEQLEESEFEPMFSDLEEHGGVTLRFVDLDADEELIGWAHLDAVELLRYACNLDSVATRPLRDAVAMRYRHIFKEVSGG